MCGKSFLLFFRFVLAIPKKTTNTYWIWLERLFVSSFLFSHLSLSRPTFIQIQTRQTLLSSRQTLQFHCQLCPPLRRDLQHPLLRKGRLLSLGNTLSNAHLITDWWGFFVCQDLSEEAVTKILSEVKIPEYRPQEKVSLSADLCFDLLWVLEMTPNLFSRGLSEYSDRWDGEEARSGEDASKQWRGEGGHHAARAGHRYRQGHTRYANNLWLHPFNRSFPTLLSG